MRRRFRRRSRPRIPRTLRKTLITIVVLLLLFVAAGVAYVYIADRNGPAPAPKTPVSSTDEGTALPKPKLPGANAQEGVAIDALTTPVAAGDNASLTASTNATSACTIDVSYNGVKSTDSGLAPQKANVYGTVTWTWTVDSGVPVGNWPIKVTCTYNGRSGVVDTSIQVTR